MGSREMNYEQRYNEVLQKVKEEYNRLGELGNESMKRRFEIIFPELAESEDERIRKSLVEFLTRFHSLGNNGNYDNWSKADCSDWIAYLEKLKEQGKYACPEEKVEDSVEVASRMNHIRQELLPIARFILGYSHWDLDKEVWNHPVAVVPVFRVLDALVQRGKPYCCSCDEQQEPKPVEWSEEYEKDMAYIIQILYDCYVYKKHNLSKTDYDNLVNKLKSIRPQPKQEWNKKDKKIVRALQHALNCADAQNAIAKSGVEVSEVATFLQDLVPSWKPSEEQLVTLKRISGLLKDWGLLKEAKIILMLEGQLANLPIPEKPTESHWKPSEEQIAALKNSAYGVYQNGDGPALRELYEQLKAL